MLWDWNRFLVLLQSYVYCIEGENSEEDENATPVRVVAFDAIMSYSLI